MLAELDEEYKQKQQEESEDLKQNLNDLWQIVSKETAARQEVEQSTETVTDTVKEAINFRRVQRAEARTYLKQMKDNRDGNQ